MEAESMDLESSALEELAVANEEQAAVLAEIAASRDWRFEPSTFSALDKTTGETVWSVEIEAGVGGSPMTYVHEGRQYVVLAVGGSGVPSELIGFALP